MVIISKKFIRTGEIKPIGSLSFRLNTVPEIISAVDGKATAPVSPTSSTEVKIFIRPADVPFSSRTISLNKSHKLDLCFLTIKLSGSGYYHHR